MELCHKPNTLKIVLRELLLPIQAFCIGLDMSS